MSSGPAVPAPGSTDGGGGRGHGGPGNRRRARNRRYHRNRSQRSLLHPGVLECGRASTEDRRARTLAPDGTGGRDSDPGGSVLSGSTPSPRLSTTRGHQTGTWAYHRCSGNKGGDVAIYVRAGVHFVPLEDRPLAAADDRYAASGSSAPGLWTSGASIGRRSGRLPPTRERTTSTRTDSPATTPPS